VEEHDRARVDGTKSHLFITIFINEPAKQSRCEATCHTNRWSIKTFSKMSSNTDKLMNRLSIICFCRLLYSQNVFMLYWIDINLDKYREYRLTLLLKISLKIKIMELK